MFALDERHLRPYGGHRCWRLSGSAALLTRHTHTRHSTQVFDTVNRLAAVARPPSPRSASPSAACLPGHPLASASLSRPQSRLCLTPTGQPAASAGLFGWCLIGLRRGRSVGTRARGAGCCLTHSARGFDPRPRHFGFLTHPFVVSPHPWRESSVLDTGISACFSPGDARRYGQTQPALPQPC